MLSFVAERDKGSVLLNLHARKPYDSFVKGRTRLSLVTVGGRRLGEPVDITGGNTEWEIRDGGHCSWALSNFENFAPKDAVENFVIRVEHLQFPLIRGVMVKKTKKGLHKLMP